MNLSAYNSANYSTAIEAEEQGATYLIAELHDINDSVTVDQLNDSGNMNLVELIRAVDASMNACEVLEHNHSVVAIIIDSNVPKFQYDKTTQQWSTIVSIEDFNKAETEASEKHLELTDYEVYVAEDPKNEEYFNITCISSDGSICETSSSIDSDGTINIAGESFDFYLKYNEEHDSFSLNLYNLITTFKNGVEDGIRMAEEECGWTSCTKLSAGEVEAKLELVKQCKLIDGQLEEIEKWSEIYCGPLVNQASVYGDDVYQAVHSMRKIIGIGFEVYDKEVARAKEIDSLEIVDGSLMGYSVEYVDTSKTEYGILDNNKDHIYIVERDFLMASEAEQAMKEYVIKTYIDPKYN